MGRKAKIGLMGFGQTASQLGGMMMQNEFAKDRSEKAFNREKSLAEIRQQYQAGVRDEARQYERDQRTPGNPDYELGETQRQKLRTEKETDSVYQRRLSSGALDDELGIDTPTEFKQFMAMTPQTQQSYKDFLRFKKGKGSRAVFGPDGQPILLEGDLNPADLTSKNQGDLQADVLGAQQRMGRLEAIAGQYADEFLTYAGSAQAGLGGFMDKSGLPFAQDAVQFNAKRQKFVTGVLQEFNSYRKEITGAAASVQELDRLEKSLFNPNQGPEEFKAILGAEIQRTIAEGDLIRRQLGLAPVGIQNQAEARRAPDGNYYIERNGQFYRVEP